MKSLLLFIALLLTVNLNAQTNNCQCCTENHSEFDFWIGSWSVTGPKGKTVGKNVINKIQGNCILQENWTSSQSSFTGTSNNFYNAQEKRWEQIWLDNQGGSLHLKGHKVGNQMILESDEKKNKDDEPFYHRITWTHNDDGSVRQYWETVKNGKDITVTFDGLYKKD